MKLEELDEISQLFFGRLRSIKSYYEKGQTKFLDENVDTFFNVLLKINQVTDLYSAWDKDHRGTIENYEHT